LVRARARYRRNPAPDYPEEARRLRQEGVVLLRVQVNARGRVEGTEVERSSGFPSLDQAAARAVRRWEFEPARRGDTPVASTVTVPVRFQLARE
jgi:protein TonB